MKVVILAGGLGTRLSEYTKAIPKPMVKINGKPILIHIINHYLKYGFNDFYIATRLQRLLYKKFLKKKKLKYKINLIDTGLKTMTGGRLKRLKNIIGDETFLLTYGNGLSNVNLSKLVRFHNKNKNSSHLLLLGLQQDLVQLKLLVTE